MHYLLSATLEVGENYFKCLSYDLTKKTKNMNPKLSTTKKDILAITTLRRSSGYLVDSQNISLRLNLERYQQLATFCLIINCPSF